MAQGLTATIAHSDEVSVDEMAQSLIDQSLSQLGGDTPQLGILFVGIHLEHADLLNRLMDQWPGLQLIGCTTDGETSSQLGTLLESAALMLLHSKTLEFSSGTFHQSPEGLSESLHQALTDAEGRARQAPTLGVMLADGLLFNGSVAIDEARNFLGPDVSWFGGMSADQWLFTGTKQFYQRRVLSQEGVFFLLHGNVHFSHSISFDWEAVGELGKITQSEGSVVRTINDIPAIDFFRQTLGEDTIPSTNNPIAIYDTDRQFVYLRTCFENVDKDTGSMTFIADMPEGYYVRLTVVDRQALIEGAAESANRALQLFSSSTVNASPTLALCFTCSARRALLGSQVAKEMVAVKNTLPDIPFIGFYTYGEIAPTEPATPSCVHNETFTILLLG